MSLLVFFMLASFANAEPFAWDLLNGKFNKAYKAALGPKAREPGLAELPGPSEEAKKLKIGGREYLYVHSCRPLECDTHNLVLLYLAESGSVCGKISESQIAAIIGKPPAAVAAELNKLYGKEFRR